MTMLKNILSGGKKYNPGELYNAVSRYRDFMSSFSAYLEYRDSLKSRKFSDASEIAEWLAAMNYVLELARKSRFDAKTAKSLIENVVLCASRTLELDREGMLKAVGNLCKAIKKNNYVNNLLEFCEKVLTPRKGIPIHAVACAIFSNAAPEDSRAIRFFQKLWGSPNGHQLIELYAMANLEAKVPIAFSEPGYTKYKNMLDWIRRDFPESPISLAAELIMGLWQGRYSVTQTDSLDNQFYQYFLNQYGDFSREMVFAISCLSLKVEKLQELTLGDQFEQLQISWAGKYKGVIQAFIQSLDGAYPELQTTGILPPKQRDYSRPLYSFMIMAYTSYAARHVRNANLDELYSKVSGPWQRWVSQFGSKEFPYRQTPDVAKYQELIYSEITSPEIKNFIAPWIVEITYYQSGAHEAESLISTFPHSLKAACEKRLSALQGRLYSAPVDETAAKNDNDYISEIRQAIMAEETDSLFQLLNEEGIQRLHPGEQTLCRIAVKCLRGEALTPAEISDVRRLGEKGLPLGLYLYGRTLFNDQNFIEAAELFELACQRAPSQIQWREFWAQSIASSGNYLQAVNVLSTNTGEFSDETKELYGWCLFVSVFPTNLDLLNYGLTSGSGLNDQQIDQIRTANEWLPIVSPLKSLVLDILEQLDNPATKPSAEHYPEFANEWLIVRKALTAANIEALFTCFSEIRSKGEKYAKPLIQQLAGQYLATIPPGAEVDQSALQQLLDIIGKTREDFYAEQFYKDLKAEISAGELYDKYVSIYPAEHPVFKLITLYRGFEDGAYNETVQELQEGYSEQDMPGLQLLALYCYAEMESWDQFLEKLVIFCQKNLAPAIAKPLVLLGIQLSIALDNETRNDFFQLVGEHKVDIQAIPPVFKSYILKAILQNVGKSTQSESDKVFEASIDPQFRDFLQIVNSPLEDLVKILPTLQAKEKWGLFVYKRVVKLLLEKARQVEINNVFVLLSSVIPAISAFIKTNQLSSISDKETTALAALERMSRFQAESTRSLSGILHLENIQPLVTLSKGLLEKINFPETIDEFRKNAGKFINEFPAETFDRHQWVINVTAVWLEFMRDQKSIRLKEVYEPLLDFLTQLRLALYTWEGFAQWYLEKRKTLPENQQYLEEAGEYLKYPFYEWFVSTYIDELNYFFSHNKAAVARLYAECLQKITDNTPKLIQGAGLGGIPQNQEAVEMFQSLCSTAAQDWVKEKKGNLENQMVPSEKDKAHYSLDYKTGLEIIKRILDVFKDDKDLLILGLDYANRWNEEHEKRAENEVRDIVAGSKIMKWIQEGIRDYSNFFADALRPLCQPGEANEHLHENQTIARHFYFKALVENQEKPYNNIADILKWEPSHEAILWFYKNRYIEGFNSHNLSANEAIKKAEELKKVFSKNKEAISKINEDIAQLSRQI